MTNNVCTFEPDQPKTIALKYRTGKRFEKNGHSGYTYSLANGLVAFLPEEAHREILALNPGIGEQFQLTKRTGGRWEGQRINPPADPEAFRESRSASATFVSLPNNTSGNIPESSAGHKITALRHALFTVIEDARAAEVYANGLGLSIRFCGADIRTMANTVLIQGGR